MCRETKNFDQKMFIDTTIKCNICLEIKDSSMFMLASCGHALCTNCIDISIGDTHDDRDSTLEATEWLQTYESTTTSVSRHWMLRKHWPSHVMEHIEGRWEKYPKVGNWPEIATYYRLS